MENFKLIIVSFLILLNVFSYFLVGYDKRRARKSEWRVPEKRFFLIGLLGGAIGIYLGMKHFRHKTKHLQFTLGIPLLILVNLVVLFYFFSQNFDPLLIK